jgi:hypothetical protein
MQPAALVERLFRNKQTEKCMHVLPPPPPPPLLCKAEYSVYEVQDGMGTCSHPVLGILLLAGP